MWAGPGSLNPLPPNPGAPLTSSGQMGAVCVWGVPQGVYVWPVGKLVLHLQVLPTSPIGQLARLLAPVSVG